MNLTMPKYRPPKFDFSDWTKGQRRTLRYLLLAGILIMLLFALAVFFLVLRGPEKVMVPAVTGMDLSDALVVLQERELYPRVSLRFTDNPLDKNTILEQSPISGAIVKAGRRIKLTVSKGAVLDKIENYVGQDLEATKLHLQSLFSASRPLVTVREPPTYRFDDSQAGTILEQSPKAGTGISGPTVLELVVSKGPESAKAQVPEFSALDLPGSVALAEKSLFAVDFSMRQAKSGEKQGIVAEQTPEAGTSARISERVKVTLTAPATSQGMITGIYVYNLPAYPYPVPVKLETLRSSGQRNLVASLKHPGGNFSMPFIVPAGSTFVLTVLDKEVARTEAK